MKKEQLTYVRITAILLSCLVASLTLCNLLTVVTHGIQFDIPEENDFTWAIDPVDKELLFRTEFAVSNHGTYDINDIDINAKLLMENDKELINFTENDLAILQGSDKIFDVIVTLDLDEISLLDWLSLVYKNTVLRLVIDIDASYMFGLLQVTVDEVLEYPWTSPLANLTQDDRVISGLFTILSIAEQGFETDFNDIKNITSILSLKNFSYQLDKGYCIQVNITDLQENLQNISCKIEVPFTLLKAKLIMDFTALFGLQEGSLVAELQEVNVTYVEA